MGEWLVRKICSGDFFCFVLRLFRNWMIWWGLRLCLSLFISRMEDLVVFFCCSLEIISWVELMFRCLRGIFDLLCSDIVLVVIEIECVLSFVLVFVLIWIFRFFVIVVMIFRVVLSFLLVFILNVFCVFFVVVSNVVDVLVVLFDRWFRIEFCCYERFWFDNILMWRGESVIWLDYDKFFVWFVVVVWFDRIDYMGLRLFLICIFNDSMVLRLVFGLFFNFNVVILKFFK